MDDSSSNVLFATIDENNPLPPIRVKEETKLVMELDPQSDETTDDTRANFAGNNVGGGPMEDEVKTSTPTTTATTTATTTVTMDEEIDVDMYEANGDGTLNLNANTSNGDYQDDADNFDCNNHHIVELVPDDTKLTMEEDQYEQEELRDQSNDNCSSNNNKNDNNDNTNSTYFLRWSRLCKTVQVQVSYKGLLRGSITDGHDNNNNSNNKNGCFRKLKSRIKRNDYANNSSGGGPVVKTILNNVSGCAAPGQVLALIGPSGSGKTTLLNALSGRTNIMSGVISVNGKCIGSSTTATPPSSSATPTTTTTPSSSSSSSMKRFISKVAYVQQEDIFFDHLTIKDQLAYTAFLRLPQSWPRNQKLDEVQRTIRLLRLTKVQNSQIKLLSGGEKKRVNIGTELLTNPSCLLLDEPTSGLDSTSAVALVKLLGTLACTQQKTVLMSIHQPSSGMFLSFDSLLLLAEGNVVYFGSPMGSIQYLKGKNLACPEGYNAADHWMDLLVSDSSLDEEEEFMKSSYFMSTNSTRSLRNTATTTTRQSWSGDGDAPVRNRRSRVVSRTRLQREEIQASRRTTRQQLIDAWDSESVAEIIDLAVQAENNKEGSAHALEIPQKYNTSWMAQYRVLVHRALKNSRSAIFTPLNMIKSAVLGVISGLLWFQLPYTERTVHDRTSYFFFTMTYWVFDSMFGALLAFPSERKVILKERASASYHLSAYFMAKTTSEAPTRLTLPLIYMTISFWMAGISTQFSLFVSTTLISLLSVLAGESYGLLVGASVDKMDRAMTTITIVALSMMLLGGFYVENVPAFVAWAKYLSPFKYSFDASRELVFDEPVPCDGSGELQDLCCCGKTSVPPDELKKFLEINGTLAFNVGMLLVLGFVPRYFAYLALKAKKGGRR